MVECRHGRPECECRNPRKISHDHTESFKSQPLSSGRWDAVGSWSDAVTTTQEQAFNWANNLDLKSLHWAVSVMADDINAFTLYEREAILKVTALVLFDKWLKEMND